MEKKNLYQKLNCIMGEIKSISKDGNISIKTKAGKTFSYSVVTHDNVASLIQPLLVKYGVCILPSVTSMSLTESSNSYGNKEYVSNMEVSINVVNSDDPKESFLINTVGLGIDQGDKGSGKAMSYAVKMAMLKLFMIPSGDNEESRSENQTKLLTGVGGEYVAQVKKFQGKKIKDIDKKELINYCEYMTKTNKDLNGFLKSFIDNARVFLKEGK